MNTFSIREAFRFGWEKTKANSGLLFTVVIILLVVNVLGSILQHGMKSHDVGFAVVSGILYVVLMIFGLVIGVGATVISLKLAKGEPAAFKDIIPSWRIIVQSVASSILLGFLFLGVMVIIGVVVLTSFFFGIFGIGIAVVAVLAGIAFVAHLVLRYSMIKFIAVDGVRPISSILPRSSEITKGVIWKLGLFTLALILINILGAIALLIGLLITIPVSMIASAYVYLKLSAGRSIQPTSSVV